MPLAIFDWSVMMWSATVVVLAVFAALVIVQGAPKEVVSFKHIARSPKRESSSLVLGGRFGRSCFFQAGGCLGKRSMKHERPSFSDQTSLDDQDLDNPPSIENGYERLRYQSTPDDPNFREIFSEDYPNYQN